MINYAKWLAPGVTTVNLDCRLYALTVAVLAPAMDAVMSVRRHGWRRIETLNFNHRMSHAAPPVFFMMGGFRVETSFVNVQHLKIDLLGYFHEKYLPVLIHMRALVRCRIKSAGWEGTLANLGVEFMGLDLRQAVEAMVRDKVGVLRYFILLVGPDRFLFWCAATAGHVVTYERSSLVQRERFLEILEQEGDWVRFPQF
jgi:hypothetical protein